MAPLNLDLSVSPGLPLGLGPGATLGDALDRWAARLSRRPWSGDFYLAGSASLYLYLRHRRGRGLDFMSGGNRLTPQKRRDLLTDLLAMDPGFQVETARDGYLFVRTPDGYGVKFFYYPYPVIDPEQEWAGLEVVSAMDLGLMKLGAIISRGSRRDFVDLFLLCKRLPLESILHRAPDKFGHVRDFPLQALKGLADLSLALGEPMPNLEEALEWSEVEEWVATEIRRLGREKVGLSEAGSSSP